MEAKDKIEEVKNLFVPVFLMFRDGQASLEASLERAYKICQLFSLTREKMEKEFNGS